MLLKLYYVLKPILPWGMRIGIRRVRARVKWRACADVWPIDPKAGATPPYWPGWPGGKKFAFVLTHDVEGCKGLARVEQLAKLEVEYGVRSCFNFVPEGEYRVPDATRHQLEAAGFEIGVHGLHHEGKLYSSRAAFQRRAGPINRYLKIWNACGFRSPMMHHRPTWLHQLDLLYDSSTFDTDPFEPEPDGVGTIFPFWVPGPNGSGYVELPYTLVQDFNLLVILRENNIDIWRRKLDWLAEHGGMALIDTHPDYMSFGGAVERDEYPASHFTEFLSYVRERYADAYWPALPREVAKFYVNEIPPASRSIWHDGRVRRPLGSLPASIAATL